MHLQAQAQAAVTLAPARQPAPPHRESVPQVAAPGSIQPSRRGGNQIITKSNRSHRTQPMVARSAVDKPRRSYLQPIVTLPGVRYYEALTSAKRRRHAAASGRFPESRGERRADREDRSPRAVARRTACAPAAAKESRRRHHLQYFTLHTAQHRIPQKFAAIHRHQPRSGLSAGAGIPAKRLARHGRNRASLHFGAARTRRAFFHGPCPRPATGATRSCRPRHRPVKVPAKLLLELADPRAFDIHPADLSDLLARFGVSLIAERVESETTVIDLLEYEVRFGQGFLFAPPRPVRADALTSVTEEKDSLVRESAKRPPQPAAAQSAIANVVDEIRRTGILPQSLPDVSRA